MANSRKFVAKTKDVNLIVNRADSLSVRYVNCKKELFQIEETQSGIKFVQTKKVPAACWLRWLAQGAPEVVVALPENIDVCELEAESNQVVVADIKADKIYAEVHNGKVEARNVIANDVFLKCFNGSAVARNVEAANVCTVDTLNGASALMGAIAKGASLEVTCENGTTEVSDENKASLNRKLDGCARYVVRCLNGKAVVK